MTPDDLWYRGSRCRFHRWLGACRTTPHRPALRHLLAFVGAFLIQWGFGASVDWFVAGGATIHDAYQRTLGLLLALQAASFAWYILAGRSRT